MSVSRGRALLVTSLHMAPARCRTDATERMAPLLWLAVLFVGASGANTALSTRGLTSDICIAPTAVGRAAFRSADGHDVELHWRRFGKRGASSRVLLIMGMAATHNAWQAQVETLAAHGDTDILVFDNRGVGESSTPPGGYTTEVMARDALALIDHVRWEDAHIIGFSMGGMVAMKLCAIAKHRVRSLCLISTHLGGFTRRIPALRGLATIAQILAAPLVRRLPAGGARLAARMRAHLDLHCHYTRRFLDSCVLPPERRDLFAAAQMAQSRVGRTVRRAARRAALAARTLGVRLEPLSRGRAGHACRDASGDVPALPIAARRRPRQTGDASPLGARMAVASAVVATTLRPPSSNYEALISHYEGSRERGAVTPGLAGQVAAVLRHRMSGRDVKLVRGHAVPKLVIHGREDIVVRPVNARVLSRAVGAELHMLESNHMAVVEAAEPINALLLRHLRHAQRCWEQRRAQPVWQGAPGALAGAVAAAAARAVCAASAWAGRVRCGLWPAFSPVGVRAS